MPRFKLSSWLSAAIIATASYIHGTELKPWFDQEKILFVRPSYTYRNYNSVDTRFGPVRHHSTDGFLNSSVLLVNNDAYSAELEYLAAYTSQHAFSGRATSLTFRYLLLDDVVGDPLSIMAGATLRYVQPRGLNDISLFYHGPFEFEPTLAFGKEMICEEYWTSRWWSMFGVGIANRGSPWIKFELNWENNWWDAHQFRLFVNTLWGLGDRRLVPFDNFRDFRGYSSIDHQSIDVGARYRYDIPQFGDISLEYYYRAYAKNGPLHVSAAMIKLTIPFGLPSFFGYFGSGL